MWFLIRLIFVTLAVPLMFCGTAAADPIPCKDISASDGDTVVARDYRWRLVGCDTPEVSSRWRRVSAQERKLGRAATAKLKGLLKNAEKCDLAEVRCSCPDKDIGTDKCNHGRKCGVLTTDDKNVCISLINEGLAQPFVCGTYKCPPMPKWDEIIKNRQP